MRFGVFDHVDDSGLPQAEHFEMRLKLVEALDRLGYDSYHTAEHHGTPLGLAPSPSVFLSAVAQRTKRLKFGPLVYLPALYHPMRLAEEIAMIDQMSRGRYQVGLGRGAVWIEQKIYGVDPESVPERYKEALEILIQALTKDRVDFKGKHYVIDDFPVINRPYQKPRPPFWYGLSSAESAVWCAQNEVNVVSMMGGQAARKPFDRYKEVWAEAGRSPGDLPVMGLNRHIVVAPTDQEAQRIARPAYRSWREHFSWLWNDKGITFPFPYPETLDDHMAAGLSIVGSPKTVADAFAHELDASGGNAVLGHMIFGSLPYEDALQSIELFAGEVMPALKARSAVPA